MVARAPPIELMAMPESICCCLWLWGDSSPGGVSPWKSKRLPTKSRCNYAPSGKLLSLWGGGGGPTDTRRRW